ncbi:MAG: ribose 5-phosphate isomerase B [Planctomycetota bacterium]|jgi:ribose 5-phosphate isomerase B
MSEQKAAPPRDATFVLGSDHAGFEMKEQVKRYLLEHGNAVEDRAEQHRQQIDFPPVAAQVSKEVAGRQGCYGILICGTGLGMSMAANKVRGVRAALLYDAASAEFARRHNDANVLVFGGRTMTLDEVRERLEVFFGHEFEGGRYAERNAHINRIGRDAED